MTSHPSQESEPRTEPLTVEEEAELRRWVQYHPPSNARWFERLLATLDAAREQAATEARRELLGKVEGPTEEQFVRLATAVMQLRDFLAAHRKATGRSDVNIRKVIKLLDDVLVQGEPDAE
jgi:hypothetical protein